MILNDKIFELLKEGQSQKATKIIDSLILKKPNNGAFYFVKGRIYEYNEYFANAIRCYQKAESLGLNKSFCESQIQFCQKLQGVKSHYKKRGDTSVL